MPRWSASSSWQRRPCGPSATLTDSRPSRGMPLSCQKLRPEHSDAACGDSVIVSEAACGACDSDARTYVQYPPPTPPRPPRLRRLRHMLHAGGWYAGALAHGAQRSLVTDVHVNAARRPPPGSSGPPGPPQARQAPQVSTAHPDPAEQATRVGPRRQVASSVARRAARRVGGVLLTGSRRKSRHSMLQPRAAIGPQQQRAAHGEFRFIGPKRRTYANP